MFGEVLGVADGAATGFCCTLTAALDSRSAAGGGATCCWATTAGGGALGLASLDDLELGVVETGDHEGDVARPLVDAAGHGHGRVG